VDTPCKVRALCRPGKARFLKKQYRIWFIIFGCYVDARSNKDPVVAFGIVAKVGLVEAIGFIVPLPQTGT